MHIQGGHLLLTSRSTILDPTLLAVTKFVKSTAASLKSSSTSRNEQYSIYFINIQFLCWLTFQKWLDWKTDPSDILILIFFFLMAYCLWRLAR